MSDMNVRPPKEEEESRQGGGASPANIHTFPSMRAVGVRYRARRGRDLWPSLLR
jgi:hypothetical protein